MVWSNDRFNPQLNTHTNRPMKTFTQILITLTLLFGLSACGGAENEAAKTGDAKESADSKGAIAYAVDETASSLKWTAHEAIGDGHKGTFPITTGTIMVDGDQITGGKVVASVADLTISDLEAGTEKYEKLKGHLKSDDFFAAEKHPEAKLEITEVKKGGDGDASHTLTANLTIRGTTKSVTFPATVTLADGKVEAEAQFAIDRMKWDVSWDKTNPAGDLIIKNMVDLDVKLVALAPQS